MSAYKLQQSHWNKYEKRKYIYKEFLIQYVINEIFFHISQDILHTPTLIIKK